MALAVNFIDRHGPSNKMLHQLQPKKTIAVYIAAKDVFTTNKTECISFKSGCVVRLAKHLKVDWLIVMR